MVAQGLLAREPVVLLADDYAEWTRSLPWVEPSSLSAPGAKRTGDESESEGELDGDGNERQGDSRIAWRYEALPRFRTTSGHTALSTAISMPPETRRAYEDAGTLTYLDPAPFVGTGVEGLLARLGELAPARLVLELGDWSLGLAAADVRRLLLGLRALSRAPGHGRVSLAVMPAAPPPCPSPSAAYSSYAPASESESEPAARAAWLASLPGLADCTLALEGFGTDPGLLQAYHPLHGFVRPVRLPAVGALLAPSYRKSELLGLQAGENNLGFRLKRKRFVVETVHLGIEGGSSERRTAPASATAARRVVATEEIGPAAGSGEVQISGGIDSPRPRPGAAAGGSAGDAGAGTAGSVDAGAGAGGAGKSALAGAAAKPKKKKVSVRFGDEDDAPGHAHAHAHTHAPRVEIRHDKPELYEF